MSDHKRFKTLIPFLTSIYIANDTADRTNTLRDGLLAIADCSDDWATVRNDADRMLRVWSSKETDPAAQEVVAQILHVLGDMRRLSSDSAPAPAPAPTLISHVGPVGFSSVPITQLPDTPRIIISETESHEDEDEEEEEEKMEVDDEEEEVEEEEEETEEEEDEDSEAGNEVEKRVVRGRTYYFDSNTNKLYAVLADDEVGDEVGILLANGAPVFLTGKA